MVLLYYVLSSLKLCRYFSVNKLIFSWKITVMNWFWSAFHSSYRIVKAETGVHNDIVELLIKGCLRGLCSLICHGCLIQMCSNDYSLQN